MKLFRVGTCLALLTASLACTQAAQPLTSPSASTGGSLANAADGTTLKMTAPGVVSPIDGVRAEDRRPTLIWLNSNGRYGPSIGVAYDIQLSTPAAVVYERTVGESSEFGAHLVEMDLDYDTVYSWRIRAHVGNPDTVGPWSNWTNFLSPTRPTAVAPPTGGGGVASGGCAAPISALAAGENRKPRPNDSATVRAVANAYPAAL
ncbi:MAG TPA: hypothetical protein VF491_22920, partial [Vicinamibacterales bacterium]